MQKSAAALVVLLLALSQFAQPSIPPRQFVISTLTLNARSHLSTADLQSITAEVQGSCCFRSQSEEIRQRILDAFEERG